MTMVEFATHICVGSFAYGICARVDAQGGENSTMVLRLCSMSYSRLVFCAVLLFAIFNKSGASARDRSDERCHRTLVFRANQTIVAAAVCVCVIRSDQTTAIQRTLHLRRGETANSTCVRVLVLDSASPCTIIRVFKNYRSEIRPPVNNEVLASSCHRHKRALVASRPLRLLQNVVHDLYELKTHTDERRKEFRAYLPITFHEDQSDAGYEQ
jgi:hypothetical protein